MLNATRARTRGCTRRLTLTDVALSILVTLATHTLPPTLAAPSPGPTAAVLLNADLQPQPILIQSIDAGVLRYFDEHRQLRATDLAQIVQLRDIAAAQAPAAGEADTAAAAPDDAPHDHDESQRLTVLTDGQRLAGRPLPSDTDGGVIPWRHPQLGTIPLTLDRISTLCGAGGLAAPPAANTADTIELVNGDTLTGIVTSFSPAGLTLQPDGALPRITIPIDRVRLLHLINPAVDPPPAVHTVHLRDGSRVYTRDLALTNGRLTIHPLLAPDARPVQLPLQTVTRIDPDGPNRLIELKDLPWRVTAGGSVFGIDTPPTTRDGALRLHAPVTVEFQLPPHALRLAGHAALDTPPDGAGDLRWADLGLTLRSPHQQPETHHLSPDEPSVYFNLPVGGPTLVLEVDPAANGPMMDRLVIRDAVVLTQLPTRN